MTKKIIAKSIGKYLNLLSLIAPSYTAKKTLEIFAKVRKGKIDKDKKFPILEEGKQNRFHCNGHEIQRYHWKGSGKKVLLLHGWESNTHRWRNLIRSLKTIDFDIHAIDAPAHGYSSGTYHYLTNYAAAATKMIEEYDIEIIVGHSMGGMAMLFAKSIKPLKTVKQLVSIGAPTDFSLIVAGYQNTIGFNKRVYRLLDQLIEKEIKVGIKQFSTSKFTYENLGELLILHDRLDPTIPLWQAERIQKNVGGELFITEGFGHSMHQKKVCQKIMEFLN
jgi:predicted alpha/beta hydrolase family esterase